MSYTIKVLAITFVSTIVFNAIDFNSDGLIAINKPFGVLLMKNGLTTGHSESLFSQQSTDFSGIQTQCRKILPAKLVERFSRGISLFASQKK
jgi:hypothetical protein